MVDVTRMALVVRTGGRQQPAPGCQQRWDGTGWVGSGTLDLRSEIIGHPLDPPIPIPLTHIPIGPLTTPIEQRIRQVGAKCDGNPS
jgi:hypothetical protein